VTERERSLLKAMESDLPCERRPFLRLAEQFGLGEAELLKALRQGLKKGLIRRYGARISHYQAGFSCNAMVVWQVPSGEVERTALILASHAAVSHCYERPTFPGFPYNLYTMIHGRRREECEKVIAEIAEASGVKCYRALWTTKEFKKSTPCYSRLLEEKWSKRIPSDFLKRPSGSSPEG